MIIEITGKCQYEGCKRNATHIASDRRKIVRLYCETHADWVADDDIPEYVVNCPNCGCRFGVN